MIKESMAKVQNALDIVMESKEFKDGINKAVDTLDSTKYFNIYLKVIQTDEEVKFLLEIIDSQLDFITGMFVASTTEKYWDLWPLICTINENIEKNKDLYFERIERITDLKVVMLPDDIDYEKAYVDHGTSVIFYIKYRGD